MLVVFDIDGTLIGGESADWAAFDEALYSVLSFRPTDDFYSRVADVTAQRLAEAAVTESRQMTGCGLEERIQAEYLRGLRVAHESNSDAFPVRPGVLHLMDHLRSLPDVEVALATGDWLSSIRFKLSAAGLDVSDLPLATSSDASSRADIIRCATARAGRSLSDVVYVGDGTWDLRTCRELGIPFIGTGSRTERLREMSFEHIVEPLHTPAFMSTFQSIRDSMHSTHHK